ncbi:hypothetical protein GQ602_004396 [Ophiocordyceps camponoti-floridani]|uniref:Uncharacterized protein n=1 Tax=Ophiocordyceps camponoti-floridani TaxID=2030778 RepID=A0A8H4Q6T5_9HYPO|nr:hypothetical protein GQ602_004396 [Ophiocordyceps camponoti-floridani]
MRLAILLTPTLAVSCAADALIVSRKCASCPVRGKFVTETNTYLFDVHQGCQRSCVPSMVLLCIKKGWSEAVFRYFGQDRRCLEVKWERIGWVFADGSGVPSLQYWEEVNCEESGRYLS